MNTAFVVFITNIILGLFGLGYYAYGQYGINIGIIGFFYAGNEVSILFMCLYYYIITGVHKLPRSVIYALFFIVAFLISTKTGIIAALVLSFFDYYYRLSRTRRTFFILLLPIIALVLFQVISFLIEKFQPEFYSFMHSKILSRLSGKNANVLDVLLSGRIRYLKANYTLWKESFSLTNFLFGTGMLFTSRPAEIDAFDTLFYHGVILFTILSLFYVYMIVLSLRKRNRRLTLFNVLYLIISFSAGHIWFSVTAGLFYAYINAYELTKN